MKNAKRVVLMLLAAVLLTLSLAGCDTFAIGKVTSSTNKKATLKFMQLSGREELTLVAGKDSTLKYTAKLGSGEATVYLIDSSDETTELFTLRGGNFLSDEVPLYSSGRIYIVIETGGKCKKGEFTFTIQ